MPDIDVSGAPFDFKGHSYVALAPAVRQRGGSIQWDNAAKRADVNLNGRTAQIQMASDEATVDGRVIRLTGTPLVLDDTLIVPRSIFEDVFGIAI